MPTAAVVTARVACVALAVVVAAGCGGDDGGAKKRAAVEAYLAHVNAVEHGSAGAFGKADQALRAFGNGHRGTHDEQQLTAAATRIRAAAQQLDRIDPPPDARRLHRDLLELYRREAALTLEVRGMARFLASAQHVIVRAQTLDLRSRSLSADDLDGYVTRLRGSASELARIPAPDALVPWRADEVDWLRALAREGAGLVSALRAGDAHAPRVFGVRFRRIAASGPGVTAAQRQAIAAYNARLGQFDGLRQRVAADQTALERIGR